MSDNYKIRVQVEIVPNTYPITDVPIQKQAGCYEWVVPESVAESIDACENALLQTAHEATRSAFAAHLTEASKKKALTMVGTTKECEVKQYRVDSELGRLTFDAYFAPQQKDETVQMEGLYPLLPGKSWYRTEGFKELAFIYGTTEMSYRKTSRLLQRVRRQEVSTPARTLQENTAVEGKAVQEQIKSQAKKVLSTSHFTETGYPIRKAEQKKYQKQEFSVHPEEMVMSAIQECVPQPEWAAAMAENPVGYEIAEQTVHISLDDVGVKRQATTRPISEEEAALKRKHAYQTVAQIKHKQDSYTINGSSVTVVLRLIIAFLLHNRLLTGNIVFFVDGQRSLYSSIANALSWFASLQLILDWYHLEKRCKEQLSMALKGRKIRNAILEELSPCLWHGCVTQAIDILNNIDPNVVRDHTKLTKLIEYLERNRPYIPCYSIRKRLGLHNSSNAGEKANDLIVSQRQKHNGMSWSRSGSVSVATLTALVRNQEYKQWFGTGTIRFGFALAS